MNEEMIDYIANILATALLSSNSKINKQILRDEHEEVLKKIIKH